LTGFGGEGPSRELRRKPVDVSDTPANLGLVTVFTIPLDLIGLVLISRGAGQFRK
jgi:hypothetical protein